MTRETQRTATKNKTRRLKIIVIIWEHPATTNVKKTKKLLKNQSKKWWKEPVSWLEWKTTQTIEKQRWITLTTTNYSSRKKSLTQFELPFFFSTFLIIYFSFSLLYNTCFKQNYYTILHFNKKYFLTVSRE